MWTILFDAPLGYLTIDPIKELTYFTLASIVDSIKPNDLCTNGLNEVIGGNYHILDMVLK